MPFRRQFEITMADLAGGGKHLCDAALVTLQQEKQLAVVKCIQGGCARVCAQCCHGRVVRVACTAGDYACTHHSGNLGEQEEGQAQCSVDRLSPVGCAGFLRHTEYRLEPNW